MIAGRYPTNPAPAVSRTSLATLALIAAATASGLAAVLSLTVNGIAPPTPPLHLPENALLAGSCNPPPLFSPSLTPPLHVVICQPLCGECLAAARLAAVKGVQLCARDYGTLITVFPDAAANDDPLGRRLFSPQ